MMYIILKVKLYDGRPRGQVWHIGERIPILPVDMEDVVEVQADGDELNFIIKSFTNLPVPKNPRVVRYFGDMARFIAANIK